MQFPRSGSPQQNINSIKKSRPPKTLQKITLTHLNCTSHKAYENRNEYKSTRWTLDHEDWLTDWGLTALSAHTDYIVPSKSKRHLKELKLMRTLKMLRVANILHKMISITKKQLFNLVFAGENLLTQQISW